MSEIKPEKILKLKEAKYLPACSEEVLKQYTENHTTDIDKMSTEAKFTASIVDASSKFINLIDIGAKPTMDGLVNSVVVNGDSISMNMLALSKKASSGKTALMKFKKKAGMGAPVKIPLWHSGFWIKVQPLGDDEIANLEFAITDKINTVGKQTRTIGLSHYEVIVGELILEAAITAMVSTSLKLSKDDDIRTFININDLNVIAWGLASTMFPDGWHGVIPCKNTAVLGEGDIARCTHFESKTIDMSELFYTDIEKLDDEHRLQMAKSGSNSVELVDALTYQASLPEAPLTTSTYKIGDAELSITLISPTCDKYFTYGNLFLTNLERATNDAVLDRDNVSPESAKNTLLSLLELQVYNHFIDSMTIEGVVVSDVNEINEMLTILFSDLEAGQKFLDNVATFIHNSIISNIGTPSYTCKACEEKYPDEVNKEEYIPLSVYNYFFILLRSKYNQLLTRLKEPKKSISVDK